MAHRGLGGPRRYRRSGARPGGMWVGIRPHGQGFPARRAVAILLAVLLIGGIAAGIILSLRGCVPAVPGPPSSPGASGSATPTSTLSVITPEPTVPPGLTEETAISLAHEAVDIEPLHQYYSAPAIYGSTMAYAAGSGSIRNEASLLNTLYIYDFNTNTEEEIAKTTLKGEVSEIHLNENYIVWVDSDNQMEHRIFRYMRSDSVDIAGEDSYDEEGSYVGEAGPSDSDSGSDSPAPSSTPPSVLSQTPTSTPAPTPSPAGTGSPSPSSSILPSPSAADVGIAAEKLAEIREVKHRKPRLRVYDDNLIYTSEDTDLELDQLYLIDLRTGEDTSIAQIAVQAAYGSSPPDVAGEMVAWAMHDPEQTDEDRVTNGEKSAVYYVHTDGDRLAEYPIDPDTSYIIPDYWRAGMYVDRPMINDDVWIWTDTLGRGGNLWLRDMSQPDAQPYIVTSNSEEGMINSISLIESYVVYVKEEIVYAYDYVQKLFYQLSPDGEIHQTPVAGGRRVVWFPKTGGMYDVLRTVTLP